MTRLRDYQIDGIKAVRQAYDRGLYRVGVSLGTGLGKTMMMAAMASKVHSEGGRTLTLLHRDVLVEQTVRRYAQFIPPEQIGVVKASRNEIDRRVIIASVHTLRSDGRLQAIPRPDLTIVDEAHVSASDLYLDVFKHFDTVPGGAGFLAGFSATWSRSDDRSLGDIWQEVVFRRSIKWAVENNYLVPPRALQLGGSLDLSDVRIGSDGDFNERDLGKVVMLPDLKDTVIQGYHQVARGRSAVLFAPTQESARYFGDALRESGVNVAEVLASTGRNARRFASAGFDNGAIKVLVTCTALSTGWDAPRCDTAIMLRPTRHAGTFVQMIGRVLRPWPSKSEALILDFVGVLDDKDMRSVIDLSPTEERINRPECQVCGEPVCSLCALCAAGQCPQYGMNRCRCVSGQDSEPIQREHCAKKIEGVHEVDLFAGTEARWLQTERGTPFVSTRDRLYFVSQVNGAWNVGWCPTTTLIGGQWVAQGLSSSDALEIGSEAALEYDSSLASRQSSWRRGDRAPSSEQIAYARQLGIDPSGMNKAALSDALSINRASKVLAKIGGTI